MSGGAYRHIMDLFEGTAEPVESSTPAFVVDAERAVEKGRRSLAEWPELTDAEVQYAMMADTDSAERDLLYQRELLCTATAGLKYWIKHVDTSIDGWSLKLAILGTGFANAHYRHLITQGTSLVKECAAIAQHAKSNEMVAAGGVILCADSLARARVVLERSLPRSIVYDIFVMAGVEGFGKRMPPAHTADESATALFVDY